MMLEQLGERRQNPPLFFDQCLQRLSLLYRPEIICAWMVAIAILDGEDPEVVHNGCGVVSDINLGLKNSREE
jgi:hypothetical protein